MNTKVTKTRILGTQLDVYTAWEPSIIAGNHSTITFFEDKCYGKIGTNPDKTLYEKYPPGTQERFDMVNKAYEEQYNRAYELIYQEYPQLKTIPHKKFMGEIEVYN